MLVGISQGGLSSDAMLAVKEGVGCSGNPTTVRSSSAVRSSSNSARCAAAAGHDPIRRQFARKPAPSPHIRGDLAIALLGIDIHRNEGVATDLPVRREAVPRLEAAERLSRRHIEEVALGSAGGEIALDLKTRLEHCDALVGAAHLQRRPLGDLGPAARWTMVRYLSSASRSPRYLRCPRLSARLGSARRPDPRRPDPSPLPI